MTAVAPMSNSTPSTASGYRVVCCHCNKTFTFPDESGIATCTNCDKRSSVGKASKKKCIWSTVIGLIFIGAGLGVTLGTYSLVATSGGLYAVWTGAFVAGGSSLLLAVYYGVMKVSRRATCHGNSSCDA